MLGKTPDRRVFFRGETRDKAGAETCDEKGGETNTETGTDIIARKPAEPALSNRRGSRYE